MNIGTVKGQIYRLSPQKNNYHLMSSDMWLGAESYPGYLSGASLFQPPV
jgi:hypothetical protein